MSRIFWDTNLFIYLFETPPNSLRASSHCASECTSAAAQTYAEIRRDRSVRAPDAIQLACAADARIDLFITNNHRVTRKTVGGIQFVQSSARLFCNKVVGQTIAFVIAVPSLGSGGDAWRTRHAGIKTKS